MLKHNDAHEWPIESPIKRENSEPNIVDGGYVLSPRPPQAKPYVKVIAIILIVLAGGYDIFITIIGIRSMMGGSEIAFNFTFYALTIGANLLIVASIVILVAYAKIRKKHNLAWQSAQFPQRESETVLLGKFSIEKLFETEFTKDEELNAEADAVDAQDDTAEYLDDNLTLISAAETLIGFMKERGLILTPASARETLSAMFASRLLVLKGCDETVGGAFIQSLSQYFGTLPYMYGADETDENDVFTATDQAVKTAAANKHLMHIACFFDVDFTKTGDPSFAQITGYAASFGNEYRVLLKGKNEWTTVPLNLWFAIIPKNGVLDNLPQRIAESAVIIEVKPRKTDEKQEKTLMPSFNRYQFFKLGSDAEKSHFLGENAFKRIDKLESAVSERVSYQIKNKGWRRIEKYSAVYLACGGGHDEAFDSVIKYKLMPEIMPLIGNNEFNLDNILN